MANRLIFEGVNDRHVVRNLLIQYNLGYLFDYKDKQGFTNLCDTLGEELQATDLQNLGIIIDADEDCKRNWQKVLHIVADQYPFIQAPVAPVGEGTIIDVAEDKRVGIWVMPDNRERGKVEDFVADLIPQGDVLWPRAKNDVSEIPDDHRLFKPTYLPKAEIHTWLAWQEEPGTRMGEALTKKYLLHDCPAAIAFVNWARRLLS
ncbi:MAG: hypothetical protein C4520_04200 [Candidatus Abyssobacteria bacterium SURF_5]|uniref:DUF4276 family protein n=1 Tax=Abyssobacteria bacterium (strain SURF_5) TaxID=2093360 RepID=A0A3A4NZJ2_ABYX5|nr:MAG: hypothetical protein C4520_04200 [Candidatus Abyssubacteria bacterium SURF_5]